MYSIQTDDSHNIRLKTLKGNDLGNVIVANETFGKKVKKKHFVIEESMLIKLLASEDERINFALGNIKHSSKKQLSQILNIGERTLYRKIKAK